MIPHMKFSRVWSALRNPSVTLAFSELDRPDVLWHIPWWVCLVLGALPLPIFLRKTEDPFDLLLAGMLAFCGLILGLLAVFSLGKGASLRADLVRLPLAFTLLVSAGLALALNLSGFTSQPAPPQVSSADAQINAELGAFAWDKVKALKVREIGVVKKVLLVDADSHQLLAWREHIVSPSRQAGSLEECDLVVLIAERWRDAPDKDWLWLSNGVVKRKRAVRYIHWQISALDPRSMEIIAEESFDGAVAPADFIELSQRFKTGAEIDAWERLHNLPPLGEFQKWLGGVLDGG